MPATLHQHEKRLQAALDFEQAMLELEQHIHMQEWHVDQLNVWHLLKYSITTYVYENTISLADTPLFKAMRASGLGLLRNKLSELLPGKYTTSSAHDPTESARDTVWVTSSNRLNFVGETCLIPGFDFLCNEEADQNQNPAAWIIDVDHKAMQNCIRPCGSIHGMKPVIDQLLDRSPGPDMEAALFQSTEFGALISLGSRAMSTPEFVLRRMAIRNIRDALRYRHVFTQLLSETTHVYFDSFGYPLTTGLCAAANLLNIPAIEVQHGVRRDVDLTSTLQFGSGISALPTKERVYHCTQQHQISAAQSKTLQDRSYRYYGGEISGQNTDLNNWLGEQAQAALDLSQLANSADCNNPIICLISHQNFDDLEWLSEALKEEGSPIVWWLRARKGAGKGSTKHFEAFTDRHAESPNLKYNLPSSIPLPLLWKHVDTHVTLYSAAAIEALGAEVPTLFLLKNARAYPSFAKHNPLFCFLGKETISSTIQHIAGRPHQ